MIRRNLLKGMLAMTIPGMGGQTPPRADQITGLGQPQGVPVAPGSTNVIRANKVIVSGAGEGIFSYSAAPAFGDLVGTDTNSSGTDQFGNAYLAGQTTYDPSAGIFGALACQNNAAGINFYQATGPGGPWTLVSGLSFAPPDQLSFVTFGGSSGGSIPQPSAGITTLGQLITALQTAGILS